MGTKCGIYTPIGNFGFLSIRRKLWSLSFPLRDDFTLNCHLQVTLVVRPLVGNFGHCPSLLGMTLLWTIHPQVTLVFHLSVGEFNHCPFPLGDDFTLDRPPVGDIFHLYTRRQLCPYLLGMALYWTVHLQVGLSFLPFSSCSHVIISQE